jgi:hypothetical protein
MTRTRMALIFSALGLAGLLGLSACGAAAGAGAAPATAADVAQEATALQAVGFETGLEAAPTPSASAAPKKGERRNAARKFLRKNTLHGEMTVQGKDGVRTVVVQRGTVTAVTAGGFSVKSTDGFALTWTFGDKLRVVQDKKAVQTSVLKVGVEVGVAGATAGGATSARLIAVK